MPERNADLSRSMKPGTGATRSRSPQRSLVFNNQSTSEDRTVGGFMLVARKLLQDPAYFPQPETRPYSQEAALLDLLFMATYSDAAIRDGHELSRGEFAAAQKQLAKRWSWTRAKVRRFLVKLLERETIEVVRTAKNVRPPDRPPDRPPEPAPCERNAATIYRFVNYERYQNGKAYTRAATDPLSGPLTGPLTGPLPILIRKEGLEKKGRKETKKNYLVDSRNETPRERLEAVRQSTAAAFDIGELVDEASRYVFEYFVAAWKKNGRYAFDTKRRGRIRRLIREGVNLVRAEGETNRLRLVVVATSELLYAIDGSRRNDHIRENRHYQTIETVLRDRGCVEKYRDALNGVGDVHPILEGLLHDDNDEEQPQTRPESMPQPPRIGSAGLRPGI